MSSTNTTAAAARIAALKLQVRASEHELGAITMALWTIGRRLAARGYDLREKRMGRGRARSNTGTVVSLLHDLMGREDALVEVRAELHLLDGWLKDELWGEEERRMRE